MLDRIVPVHRTDLISLYYAMFAIGASAPTKINATKPGVFAITAAGLCLEPVKTAKISAASGVIYFVPAFDFEGFTNGSNEAITIAGAQVEADGRSLYSLTISDGTYTAAKVTLQINGTVQALNTLQRAYDHLVSSIHEGKGYREKNVSVTGPSKSGGFIILWILPDLWRNRDDGK